MTMHSGKGKKKILKERRDAKRKKMQKKIPICTTSNDVACTNTNSITEVPDITISKNFKGKINALSSSYARQSKESVDKRKKIGQNPLVFDDKPPVADFSCYKAATIDCGMLLDPVHIVDDLAGKGDDSTLLVNQRFQDWITDIYKTYTSEGLNYFEHNINVWEQLRLGIEMATTVVIVADCRHPLLFIPISLYTFLVKQVPRRKIVIALSKCDLVSRSVLECWYTYVSKCFTEADVVKFSVLQGFGGKGTTISARRKHLKNQSKTKHAAVTHSIINSSEEYINKLLRHCLNTDITTEYDKQVITFVGQPNSGKSSIINSLLGEKRVSVSRIAGHTKRIQTFDKEIKFNYEKSIVHNVRICDSPGLLFPLVSDKVSHAAAQQEIFGMFPFPQVRESFSALRIIAEHFNLIQLYQLKHPDAKIYTLERVSELWEWTPWDICDGFAEKRNYRVKGGGGEV